MNEDYNTNKDLEKRTGMTLMDYKTQTWFDNGYCVDIVTNKDVYEAWIYFVDYTAKHFMFGCSQKDVSYHDFLQLVAGNIDDYKNLCDFD